MSGPNTYHVRLQLSLQAKNLLLEEYPLAEKSIRKNGDHYIFDDDVRAMEGVGRFVIGLASDITIIEGTELREYIRNFVSRHLEKV